MAIKITGPIGGGAGGATTLGGLSDVTISGVANGEIIQYNSTSGDWENGTLTGQLTYKGTFNATTGTPSLLNALQGDFYVIGTAGTIYGQTWAVGDHLLINEDMGGSITNSKIDKIDNTDQVTSVNGRTGAVTGLLENVVEDTTPQLGGNLDVNGNSIVSASAGNIAITPDTTGSIVLDGLSWPQADGSADQVLKTNGAGQLSFTDPTSGLQDVVDDTTPQLGGNLDVNGQSIVSVSAGNIAITPDTTGSIVLDGLNWPQADGSADQVLKTNGAGQLSFVDQTSGLQDVVDDTTPQLGGNLDVNGQSIVSASAGNIAITPDTTGSIVLDGQNWPQADGTTGQYLSTNGSGQLSWVTAAGASRPTVYSVSANTTIGADAAIGSGELERIYIVDTTSAVTMTLPQITGNVGNGYKLNIKRDGGNTATITPNAADNIDGGTDGASITLDVDKASFTLVCDGTNWQII